MESNDWSPSSEDAAAALADAEASRASLARDIVLPPFFYGSLGTAIAIQVATTAVALAHSGAGTVWLVVGGVALFLVVAAVELTWFRRLNGVWLGGFASRVIGGTATAASISYGLALAGALWASFSGLWWVVALCSIGGGLGYALSGRRWLRSYRNEPAKYSRGESAAWLAVLGAAATAGLVLLMVGR